MHPDLVIALYHERHARLVHEADVHRKLALAGRPRPRRPGRTRFTWELRSPITRRPAQPAGCL